MNSTVTPKKYLIISPAWVGDIVMSQVLLRMLKTQDPTCVIDVLAPEWGRPLLARMPEIRQIFTMPLGHGQLQLNTRWKLGKSLRNEAYDQAIVLPNSWKSALIPFAAKITKRTGWLGEQRWFLLNDARILNKAQLPLMIQRFSALGLEKNSILSKELPYPQLKISSDAIKAVRERFSLPDTQQPILAICPGAEYGSAKRWPAAYFAEVASQKILAGWEVWIFGSSKDQLIAQEIQAATQHSCVDLTGKTNLGDAIDLLSLATVVVSNDSGLMHAAAALQKPVVVVYGSSSPRFTPPLTNQVKVLNLGLSCSPCFKRECPLGHLKCLNDLKPAMVLQALNSLAAV